MSSPVLGGVTLSGTEVVTFAVHDEILEHQIPAREGGITERTGSRLPHVRMQGHFDSGDTSNQAMLGMLQTVQSLYIPSCTSGTAFFSGNIYIEQYIDNFVTGVGYPYYKWQLNGPASGQLNVIISSFVISGLTVNFSGASYEDLWNNASFYTSGTFWLFYISQNGAQSGSLVYLTIAQSGQAIGGPTLITSGVVDVGFALYAYATYYDGTYIHYGATRKSGVGTVPGNYYRRGQPASGGAVVWSQPEQFVSSGSTNYMVAVVDDANNYPMVAIDFNGNVATALQSSTNDGTWSTNASSFISGGGFAGSFLVPTGGSNIYAVPNTPNAPYLWNGSVWAVQTLNSGSGPAVGNRVCAARATGSTYWILVQNSGYSNIYLSHYTTNEYSSGIQVTQPNFLISGGDIAPVWGMTYDDIDQKFYVYYSTPYAPEAPFTSGQLYVSRWDIGTQTTDMPGVVLASPPGASLTGLNFIEDQLTHAFNQTYSGIIGVFYYMASGGVNGGPPYAIGFTAFQAG
jgi:hypothetical protein